SCLMGLGSLGALVALRHWLPRWPSALIVSVAAIALAWGTGYTGYMVGAIPTDLPHLSLPSVDGGTMVRLLPDALWVTMIGLLEVVSSTRRIERKTGTRIDLDQEMVGQGLASVSASVIGAFPVSGSVNRSAFNAGNGAVTGFSNVVAAVLVLMALIFLGPVI